MYKNNVRESKTSAIQIFLVDYIWFIYLYIYIFIYLYLNFNDMLLFVSFFRQATNRILFIKYNIKFVLRRATIVDVQRYIVQLKKMEVMFRKRNPSRNNFLSKPFILNFSFKHFKHKLKELFKWLAFGDSPRICFKEGYDYHLL